MKAAFQIQSPDEVQVSMTLTMSLKDWRRLREQLAAQYPAWYVGRAISELVGKATEAFHAKHDVTEP